MLSHAARQVELRRAAHLCGLPVAVVQYNPLGDLQSFAPDDPRRYRNESNGSLIAVSYEARKYGVKRQAHRYLVVHTLLCMCCVAQSTFVTSSVRSLRRLARDRA